MPVGTSFISVGEIITAAAQELKDPEFGRLGRPVYLSAAQRAITEMNYETQFFKKEISLPMPENGILDLPEDISDIETLYAFNGDSCQINHSVIISIKPNMFHQGGKGYLANNRGRNFDKLQWSLKEDQNAPTHIYFAGLFNGKLYLSPSCNSFSKIHITYSGIGVDCFGEDFQVPMWAREAITDFVILRAALNMEMDAPNFYARVINRKQEEMKSPNGSWMNAIGRCRRLDKKGRYDSNAYLTRFGHTP